MSGLEEYTRQAGSFISGPPAPRAWMKGTDPSPHRKTALDRQKCPLSTATSPGSRSLPMPCRGTAEAEPPPPRPPGHKPHHETPSRPGCARARGPGDGPPAANGAVCSCLSALGNEAARAAAPRGGRRTARPRLGPLDTRHPVGPLFTHPCPQISSAPTADAAARIGRSPRTHTHPHVRRCTTYIYPSSSSHQSIALRSAHARAPD